MTWRLNLSDYFVPGPPLVVTSSDGLGGRPPPVPNPFLKDDLYSSEGTLSFVWEEPSNFRSTDLFPEILKLNRFNSG